MCAWEEEEREEEEEGRRGEECITKNSKDFYLFCLFDYIYWLCTKKGVKNCSVKTFWEKREKEEKI
jgi:hypothetical protein